MGKDKGASMVEYALLFVLITVIALVAISLASDGGVEQDIAEIAQELEYDVETYEVGHYTGTIIRWEDPDYGVVCWTRLAGRTGGGVSCIPKSQLTPTGPTVIPSDK